MRAVNCRHGVEQMRADLDEAAQKYAAAGIATPTPAFYRGVACILTGTPGRGDTFFQDAVSVPEQTDAQDVLAAALDERSLLAMSHGDWSQAQALADQALAAAAKHGAEEALAWVAPASPRTGPTSRPHARHLPTPSGCGICFPAHWPPSPCRPGSSSSASTLRLAI